MVLGPTDNTWPSTNSYQGGVVKQTNVKITILSESGFIMLFKVEGLSGSEFAPSLVAVDPTDLNEEINSVQTNAGNSDPNTTGATITWIMSLLAGVAATLGVALFFFM